MSGPSVEIEKLFGIEALISASYGHNTSRICLNLSIEWYAGTGYDAQT